ncbi:hypothetical protein FRX31_008854 [Thalictrum thalictroides]|uniref:Ubiquitin-like protease family profile domain-containing protein n=1 Tax=Thalictrum thalictroides TaxID=46969 RepID=A0A7J6WVY6_THATH|nr:hypothetical protein FRX31_008854 [Thalictrum thalictroides]
MKLSDFQEPKIKNQKKKTVDVGMEVLNENIQNRENIDCQGRGRGGRGGGRGSRGGGRGSRGGGRGRGRGRVGAKTVDVKVPKLKTSPLLKFITQEQQAKMKPFFDNARMSNIVYNHDDQIMIFGEDIIDILWNKFLDAQFINWFTVELYNNNNELRELFLTQDLPAIVLFNATCMKNYITPLLNKKFESEHLEQPFKGDEEVIEMDTPHQGATTDCAIFVCEFMEILAFKNIMPHSFEPDFASKKRVKYAEKLISSWDINLDKQIQEYVYG